MQFLESSVFGLRSARTLWRHPGGGRVTLFPMVHVGEPAFYEAVRDAAAAHDFVLYEGVRSPVVRRLTTAYRWIDTRRLGLAVQPRGMFDDLGDRALRADLEPAEFEALWREVRLPVRAAARVAFPATGLWQRLTATRASLARGMCQDDLPSRADVLAWNRATAPFLTALLVRRDARLVRVLRHLLAGDGRAASVAVVYGAAHMPAAARALGTAGHAQAESRWMTVIGL